MVSNQQYVLKCITIHCIVTFGVKTPVSHRAICGTKGVIVQIYTSLPITILEHAALSLLLVHTDNAT